MKQYYYYLLFAIVIYFLLFAKCNCDDNLFFFENFASKTKPKPKKKTYPCKYCGEIFESKIILNKHEKEECDIRPYKPKIEKLKSYGGDGGNDFTFTCPSQKTYDDDSIYINKITGKSGTEVDSIQVYCSNGSTSKKFGGDGGNEFDSGEIDDGLTYIEGRSGGRIDKLKVNDKEFGGNGGNEFNLSCTKGKIVGIYGKSGARLDKLGIVCDNNIE